MYTYKAKCLNVVDGDTVDLQIDLGFYMTATIRVRLLGIDTPEIRSSIQDERVKAAEAKAYLQSLLSSTYDYLLVKTAKADSFGRWLADISIFNAGVEVNVNQDLLLKGYAVAMVR